jgi:Domain of unknown function (DUF4470)
MHVIKRLASDLQVVLAFFLPPHLRPPFTNNVGWIQIVQIFLFHFLPSLLISSFQELIHADSVMLTPAIVNIVSYYYPIGNTPAVCLTQDLAPEQPANILLLGCGDVRNVLFTAYSDSAFSQSSGG